MIEQRTPARGRYALRLSARELQQCRDASQVLGMRVSAFIRAAAISAARAQLKPATVRVGGRQVELRSEGGSNAV